jgi:Xaa-Pro aminopeptidase
MPQTPHWTAEQLVQHQHAADALIRIKDDAFDYIKSHVNCTEYQVQQFILQRFREEKLSCDSHSPIVAFGSNTAEVHYFPQENSSLTLKPNMPIMIDIWARQKTIKTAPYADITWMGYAGTPDVDFLKIYNLVITARNAALSYIQQELAQQSMPIAQKIDRACRNVIENAGYGKQFPHTTGHCLGTASPHGLWGAIRRTNNQPLHQNLGYTIEPGIYLPGKYGARSEINFYITENFELKITTAVQQELTS